jgi:hypothetical protein
MINITRRKLLMPFSSKGNPIFMFMLGILLSMILACLLIIPVIATDSLIENNSVPFQTISGASLPLTIPEDIITAIAEKKVTQNRIDQAMIEREKKISEGYLKDNDSDSTRIQNPGLKTQNPEDIPKTSRTILMSPANYRQDIPVGGYVEFGVDGKTRVFSEDGTQIFYSDDNNIDNSVISSGIPEPITQSLSVPSGATVNDNGEFIHVTYKGIVLVTIINRKNVLYPSQSNGNLSNSSLKEQLFFPSNQ